MTWRRLLLLIHRISPWHRGYLEGWDDGIRESAAYVEVLLDQPYGDHIPRAAVKDLAARIWAETDDPRD